MPGAVETLDLREIHLFANLDNTILDQIAPAVALRQLRKGQVLYLENEPCHAFYALRSGAIKIYKLAADGREYVLMTVRPGQTFAEVPVFDGERYPANAEALRESELFEIDAVRFRSLLCAAPDVALALLAGMSRRLRAFTDQLAALTFRDVTARLAGYLLEMADTNGVPRADGIHVDLAVSQQDLAASLGTVREIVSRSLRKLEHAKLISHTRKHIIIHDRVGLAALA